MGTQWHSTSTVSSSYPSIFGWLAAFHPELLEAILFIAVCQLLCFWRLAISIVVEVFPRSFFSVYCSFKDVYYKHTSCLIVWPIHEWLLFFKIFTSNFSPIALWKTSSFVILSVHFIFNNSSPAPCCKSISATKHRKEKHCFRVPCSYVPKGVHSAMSIVCYVSALPNGLLSWLFKPRIKSHLLFAGIIRSSPFSPR